ncbi:hypothetical protein [Paraburkholderia terricola]|uniref:hypothetical protein n=1 Tax=Paraburkholderia terricola TaxID=169427 RepID=UPI001FD028E3|nr:hypothetical protein [Paraburkholderia terricola]
MSQYLSVLERMEVSGLCLPRAGVKFFVSLARPDTFGYNEDGGPRPDGGALYRHVSRAAIDTLRCALPVC